MLETVDGDALEYWAVHGSLAGHHGFRVPIDGSVAGRVVRSNAPCLLAHAADDRGIANRLGLRSAAFAPIVWRADGALDQFLHARGEPVHVGRLGCERLSA